MRYFSKVRKGQNFVLEEVLYIALAILMLSGVQITFNSINDHVSENIESESQMQVSNFVISSIDKLVSSNITEGYIMVQIPETISSEQYIISGFNPARNKFMIKMSKSRVIINTTAPVSGIVSSSSKLLKVEYDGTSILLRGGDN